MLLLCVLLFDSFHGTHNSELNGRELGDTEHWTDLATGARKESIFKESSFDDERGNAGNTAYIGFSLLVESRSPLIFPDLSRQLEFRTSQLAVFKGKVYASRKVLYQSTSKPRGVMVVALDAHEKQEVLQSILQERVRFCQTHHYGLYARYIQDFAAEGKPAWEALGMAPIRLLRQAMLAFPQSEWFWLYSPQGHIKRPESPMLPLLNTEFGSLQLAMDTNVPEMSIEHFALVAGEADVIVTPHPDNSEQLTSRSLLVRRSMKSQVLLELLLDPIVQDIDEFKGTDDHAGLALTHMARWHPLLVKSMVLVTARWSGLQSCRDSFDQDSACWYDSLGDRLEQTHETNNENQIK